ARIGLARGAVAERSGDDELALAADLHPGDSLVPAGDHLAHSDLEGVRAPAGLAAGVENRPGGQPPRVLDRDVHALLRDVAGPHLELDELESVGVGDDG